MQPREAEGLIFDWAGFGPHRFHVRGSVEINDETLRDGLQCASVSDPPIEAKLRIVHLMDRLGIECASMGLPCAGPRQKGDVVRLCREIAERGLRLRPNCGGRTVVADVEHIVDVAQQTGHAVEACLFIGSSPLRHYAEEWDFDAVVKHTRDAVGLAVKEGLRVTFITEDTVRAAPEQLEPLFRTAVDAGATRICLCDTVGAAIPAGVRNLVEWTRTLLESLGTGERTPIGIDWHGHRDRGLGLANTLAAIQGGATRVHGTAYGIGERVGNTATEELLVNLHLLGMRNCDLSHVPEFVETVAHAVGVTIAPGSPIVGRDAFRTATGVHAAAVLKARSRGEEWIADRVYSAIPASELGRRQRIELGPLSGRANVLCFLREHDLPEEAELVARLLTAAKASNRVLREDELLHLVASHRTAGDATPSINKADA